MGGGGGYAGWIRLYRDQGNQYSLTANIFGGPLMGFRHLDLDGDRLLTVDGNPKVFHYDGTGWSLEDDLFVPVNPNYKLDVALRGRVAIVSVAQDDLIFTLRSLPPNSFGLLFMGGDQDSVILGDGLRVVGAGASGILRFLPQQANSAGVLSGEPGLSWGGLGQVLLPFGNGPQCVDGSDIHCAIDEAEPRTPPGRIPAGDLDGGGPGKVGRCPGGSLAGGRREREAP